MPFSTAAPSDKERIRRAIAYPATADYLNVLGAAMTELEANSPETVDTVVQLLDEFDQLRTGKSTALGGTNFALIQAGELRWESGARTGGFEMRQQQITNELRSTLDLKTFEVAAGLGSRTDDGYHGTPLYRS